MMKQLFKSFGEGSIGLQLLGYAEPPNRILRTEGEHGVLMTLQNGEAQVRVKLTPLEARQIARELHNMANAVAGEFHGGDSKC